MSSVVVSLIGIVTLFCGPKSGSDPCKTGFPHGIRVFLPDGRFNSKVCMAKLGGTIRPHEGFIRVTGATRPTTSSWPGAIGCSDFSAGPICILYPLNKDTISIEHVTSGGGVSAFNNLTLVENNDLRWQQEDPTLVITPPPHDTIGTMTIKNGTIDMQQDSSSLMVYGTVTVTGVSDSFITVQAGAHTVDVPAADHIDVINLPRVMALAGPLMAHTPMKEDAYHFFLHYLLADRQPTEKCCGPLPSDDCPRDNPPTPARKARLDALHARALAAMTITGPPPTGPFLGGTLACSNSVYP